MASDLKGYDKEIQVIRTGCFGLCAAGPIVVVYPAGVYYSHVTPDDVEEIVNEHLIKGRPVQRLIYKEMDEKGINTTLNESDFYKKQHRIALRNCGLIDPENIDEYIAFDGYKALEKCLTQLSRDDVVEMVVASGLRGRGGGTEEKPVGLVYIGCSIKGEVTVKEYHFSGTRSQIREATTSAALILMRSCILKYFSKVTFGKK